MNSGFLEWHCSNYMIVIVCRSLSLMEDQAKLGTQSMAGCCILTSQQKRSRRRRAARARGAEGGKE
eukprot:scaffold7926_cov147-Skeletonema_marinoi.AAC.5